MAIEASQVRAVIDTFVERLEREEKPEAITDATNLFGSGLELDSLETAELSVMLEDEFGNDPFTENAEMPQSIGAVLAFYGVSSAA